MTKWCGIKKSEKSEKYRIIVPMDNNFIADNMIIYDKKVSGYILTKWFADIEEAKKACAEFNILHEKYN